MSWMKALEGGWRYPTSKGNVTTEQLFQLPLEELDGTYQRLDAQMRSEQGGSVLRGVRKKRTNTMGKMEIVLAVIRHKEDKIADKEERIARRQEAEKLDDLIALKEQEALMGKSLEELQAMRAKI